MTRTGDGDLQRVLDAVLDGVIVLDDAGVIERLNAEASRILEVSAATAVGSPLEHVLGPDHAASTLAASVRESARSAAQDEVSLARRYEDDLIVDVAVSPILEPDRSVSGAVVLLRDRTIRSSLERIDSERSQLAAYGRIAAGIAHEVKNPLGGIRGAGEILAARARDDKSRETAELIVGEVDRITALVDDLMVFTRGEALRIEPLNLHRVIDETLDLLAMDPVSSSVELVRLYDPSIPDFEADPDRLTQIFLNLGRNACQAMEKGGGRLQIATRMALDLRLTDAHDQRWPAVTVAFEDTGPGIPTDLLDRLATPFFTTRPRGTGLGLAVSRYWASRHGGTLGIESEPGAGTRVVVSLPLRHPRERSQT